MKILIISILLLIICLVWKLATRLIETIGFKKGLKKYRIKYVIKTLNLAFAILMLLVGSIIFGLKSTEVLVFLSSIFTVLGIALFAQWSILSNITGSLIIFFAFPYKVGDKIRVIDSDDDISGIIEEITLFHVLIRNGNMVITYPNNQIMQKGVIKYRKVGESRRPIAIKQNISR